MESLRDTKILNLLEINGCLINYDFLLIDILNYIQKQISSEDLKELHIKIYNKLTERTNYLFTLTDTSGLKLIGDLSKWEIRFYPDMKNDKNIKALYVGMFNPVLTDILKEVWDKYSDSILKEYIPSKDIINQNTLNLLKEGFTVGLYDNSVIDVKSIILRYKEFYRINDLQESRLFNINNVGRFFEVYLKDDIGVQLTMFLDRFETVDFIRSKLEERLSDGFKRDLIHIKSILLNYSKSTVDKKDDIIKSGFTIGSIAMWDEYIANKLFSSIKL